MINQNDKNYVSVASWMGMLFVTAIPIIGWILILVWAFSGDNESRQNYFRAILLWVLIAIIFVGIAVVIGVLPELSQQLRSPRR